MPRDSLLALLLVPLCSFAQTSPCPSWSEPERIGKLDIYVLPEASGIEFSAESAQLYVMNDGTEPVFEVMRPDGSDVRHVRVAGFRPLDLEDLALGPCEAGQCLVLGDIGDNATRRDGVQFALVPEQRRYPDQVEPLRVVRARYPDGPRDAEAMAVDANGDLWLVTKTGFQQPAPALVFRLPAAALTADGIQTLEPWGEIPTTDLGQDASSRRVPTGMDIAPDGRRFVLMTYDVALEFGFALGDGLPGKWREGADFRVIEPAPLIQLESIAYADDGRAIVYTTESVQGTPAPIMRQSCH
jgi:hypothetical protein